MKIQQNRSLLPLNTFGMDETAAYFANISSIDDLVEAADLPLKKFILGGGSNILITAPVNGLVLHNCLKGIDVINEDDNYTFLKVQSGEVWHGLVLYAIDKGLGGIENLALIPGTVGAAPIQNIGAYGVEVKDVIESVTYFDWKKNTLITLQAFACNFGYRDSIFKHELKDKGFITSVVFRLSKKPAYNTGYGAIEVELKNMEVNQLSVKAIANAVINIRTSKLPDPKKIGNAGSFFKNPTIPISLLERLQILYPNIPHYPVNESMVKIPAGWLIEQCGWKGYKDNNIGVHALQALVLVNYGGASGKSIYDLSQKIIKSVQDKFGIGLESEVGIW